MRLDIFLFILFTLAFVITFAMTCAAKEKKFKDATLYASIFSMLGQWTVLVVSIILYH